MDVKKYAFWGDIPFAKIGNIRRCMRSRIVLNDYLQDAKLRFCQVKTVTEIIYCTIIVIDKNFPKGHFNSDLDSIFNSVIHEICQ